MSVLACEIVCGEKKLTFPLIYLFLEGELVGEAYCSEFLDRRVSVWEATAERRADKAQKVGATAESLENRQKIQRKASAGRHAHSLETKRLEKQRQLDLQRQEIHPHHVQEVLQALGKQQAAQMSGLLPPAVPRADPPGTPVNHLAVRKLKREDDESLS